MIKLVSFAFAAAAIFAGCAATKPLTPLDQTIPQRSGYAAVTIIAPQEQHLPAAVFNTFTNYDYYLDCLEDRCRVGTMHMLQYITIYPSAGTHTLHAKQSSDGITNTLNIIDANVTQSVSFNAVADTRAFIYHGWEFSLTSLVAPIVAVPSKLSIVDEPTGQTKLQKVLDTTSIFGDKMMGYGEKGTVYAK